MPETKVIAGAKEVWTDVRAIFQEPLSDRASRLQQELAESDSQARRFGYFTMIVLFAVFGVWSIVAPIESAARGAGVVQVEGNRKPVQHLEGGIIAEVYVASGDSVAKGQPLIKLDSTRADAELSITVGRWWQKRALLDRLISERDGLSAVRFSPWLLEVKDQRAVIAMDSESALFMARRADRLGETEVLNQQIRQLERRVIGAQSVRDAKAKIAKSLEDEVADLAELLAQGYVDRQRIRELERALEQTIGDVEEIDNQIEATKVSIVETQLKVLQLDKRFKTQVVDALTKAEEEFYDLAQQHKTLADKSERTLIRSPAEGEVLGLKYNSPAAVVKPGEELMTIVPAVEQLVIHAKISPMDIDRIRIGQEAEVRFAVFKDAYSVTGTLTKLSGDHLIDEMSGEPYFEAKIRLESDDLLRLGDERLVPGMPADVLITTGSRSFMGYVTSPLRRMFENAFIEG